MPQKNNGNQDVFERGQKIGGDWFDSTIKKSASSIEETRIDPSNPKPKTDEEKDK